MKFASALIAVLLLSTPAFADRGDEQAALKIVIAKTTSEQRAVAESISGRLRSALESEPYTLDTDGRDVSIRR